MERLPVLPPLKSKKITIKKPSSPQKKSLVFFSSRLERFVPFWAPQYKRGMELLE